MDSKLPTLLHDLASEMPADAGTTGRATLRRARIRRGASALIVTLVVIGATVGGLVGTRALSPLRDRPPAPAATSPEPSVGTSFLGLWPETTPEALAVAQAQVDAGHQPLRLDPEQTAVELATNVFGWSSGEVRSTIVDHGNGLATVKLWNATFPPSIPPIGVGVSQLGRTGPDGVWTVVKVSTPLIHVARSEIANGTLSLSGSARFEAAYRAEPLFIPEPPSGASTAVAVDGDRFVLTTPMGDTQLALWFLLQDDRGRAIGATAVPLPATRAPTTSTGPDVAGAPPNVAVTAREIFDAAGTHDVDALARLIDADTFVFDFRDGADPTERWRGDPTLLDAIPAILRLPPVIKDVEGSGLVYVWPYLMKDGALDELDGQEWADLHALGFSAAEIVRMRAFGRYAGPRLAIASDGTWLSYVPGGD